MSEEQDQVTPPSSEEAAEASEVAVENGDEGQSAFSFSP